MAFVSSGAARRSEVSHVIVPKGSWRCGMLSFHITLLLPRFFDRRSLALLVYCPNMFLHLVPSLSEASSFRSSCRPFAPWAAFDRAIVYFVFIVYIAVMSSEVRLTTKSQLRARGVETFK